MMVENPEDKVNCVEDIHKIQTTLAILPSHRLRHPSPNAKEINFFLACAARMTLVESLVEQQSKS